MTGPESDLGDLIRTIRGVVDLRQSSGKPVKALRLLEIMSSGELSVEDRQQAAADLETLTSGHMRTGWEPLEQELRARIASVAREFRLLEPEAQLNAVLQALHENSPLHAADIPTTAVVWWMWEEVLCKIPNDLPEGRPLLVSGRWEQQDRPQVTENRATFVSRKVDRRLPLTDILKVELLAAEYIRRQRQEFGLVQSPVGGEGPPATPIEHLARTPCSSTLTLELRCNKLLRARHSREGAEVTEPIGLADELASLQSHYIVDANLPEDPVADARSFFGGEYASVAEFSRFTGYDSSHVRANLREKPGPGYPNRAWERGQTLIPIPGGRTGRDERLGFKVDEEFLHFATKMKQGRSED